MPAIAKLGQVVDWSDIRAPLGYADECAVRANGAQNRSRARRQRNDAYWFFSIRFHVHQKRIADHPSSILPIDSAPRVCCTASLIFRRTIVRVRLLVLSFVLSFSALAQTSSAPSKSEVVTYHAAIDKREIRFRCRSACCAAQAREHSGRKLSRLFRQRAAETRRFFFARQGR